MKSAAPITASSYESSSRVKAALRAFKVAVVVMNTDDTTLGLIEMGARLHNLRNHNLFIHKRN